MKVDKDQIVTVLYRHGSGQPLNEEQRALLEQWLQQSPANQEVFAQLQNEKELDRYLAFVMDEQHTARAFEAFQLKIAGRDRSPVHRIHFLRTAWFRYVAAAVLLFAVCGLWFVVGRRSSEKPDIVQAPGVLDVAPGRNGAVLTLADGSSMVLDSMANGVVAEQNGSSIALGDGQLKYEKSEVGNQKSEAYNILSTPRGRQFQLLLPDGTKVWLNAASSITYPVAFNDKQRKVKITGEAYFEVSKNKEKPFIVDVAGKQTVEVLGTHFNINSYADADAIRTTLLEGSVRVTRNAERVTLKSGDQAIAAAAYSPLTIDHSPNIDQVMSWKNGLFNFNGVDLKTVLQQLSRWYDVDIAYEGNIPPIHFVGEMGRDLNLSEVLEALQRTDVHFRIDGKKLIIMP